ncbi:hypothetical protein ZIOFF_063658 [Zingiber officinale]|uniref:non-specific serine/threonine protein kinase n=1 Tax=Zingiber officinale TaxID=94328 RepID=A0A8J5F5B8_ZINOF|nr:hypothetical protein ZIOFF_063658 [Zingiber officinale]
MEHKAHTQKKKRYLWRVTRYEIVTENPYECFTCCQCNVLMVYLFIFSAYETVTENPTDLENPQPSPRGTRSFTYEELAISTNNFSMDNVLGEGGFSLVYKGTLTDGTKVAIKRLKDTHRQPDLEFMKEADILSLVHHRHLVSLIGFYVSELICLLVCEYVPNKTLEFHLHGRNGPTLAWKHRFRISLDSAKGLEYLHEHCNPRVIHRDIKAANILLDDQFRAKIADFGIAKHFSDEKTHVSTVVKGTYGYLAPEYASTGQLTDKSDVYSYGVLLLELITGRRPLGLADWARPLLQQAMENGVYDALIDPSLEKNYSPVEAGTMVACASACLNRAAALRPSMSQGIGRIHFIWRSEYRSISTRIIVCYHFATIVGASIQIDTSLEPVHVKLLALDLLSLTVHNSPHSSSVTFSRKGMHVARAETVGVVVILDRGDDYITFQREHGWYLGMAVEIARMEASVVELGKLVRIRGRITLYQGSIQLKVRNVLVENDPNMEILHSLDCIRLTKEVYDKRSSSNR